MTQEWDVNISDFEDGAFYDNKGRHEALGLGAVVSEGKGQCR